MQQTYLNAAVLDKVLGIEKSGSLDTNSQGTCILM